MPSSFQASQLSSFFMSYQLKAKRGDLMLANYGYKDASSAEH
jgi:hypothetical protein